MQKSIKPIRIYIENSVIGGYFDLKFKDSTRRLFHIFQSGIFIPVISSHVEAELAKGAPEIVKNIIKTLNYELIVVTEEMDLLTGKYMDQNIVSKKYEDDAQHIAIATVSGVDILVSWNFKHIVNFHKIRKFNAVNKIEGYQTLDIRTPEEVIEND